MKDYSGPAGLQRPPASASIIDAYRSALEQFAAVSASSVSAPSMAGTINFGAAMSGGVHLFGHGPAGHQGRQDRHHAGRAASFHGQHAAGRQGRQNDRRNRQSRLARFRCQPRLPPSSIRKRPTTTAITASTARRSAGPYTVTSAQGLRMRIDGMTVDDVGVRPSRLQFPALLAMIQAAGRHSDAGADARDDRQDGRASTRACGSERPRCAAFRPKHRKARSSSQRSGSTWKTARSANLQSKGLIHARRKDPSSSDASRSNPSISPTSCECRRSSRTRHSRPRPTDRRAVSADRGRRDQGRHGALQEHRQAVNLDSFDLNWGQFVGPIPSKARLTVKMTTPVDATDPAMKALVAAGLDTLSVDVDLGAAWTEAPAASCSSP